MHEPCDASRSLYQVLHISCVADALCDVQIHQKTPLTGLPDVHGDEEEKICFQRVTLQSSV